MTRTRYLAAAAVLLPLLIAAPAHAIDAPEPTTATERCRLDTTPDLSADLHLEGGRGTTVPSAEQLELRPGDVVRLTPLGGEDVSASGWWWQPADGSNWVSPQGVEPPVPAPDGYPAPGLNKYSLIGRFGGHPPFEVAGRPGCLQVGGSFRLDLRINDDQDWDNFGAWDVRVQVWRAPLVDGDFEQQRGTSVAAPWFPEGFDTKVLSPTTVEGNGARTAVLSSGGRRVWNALIQTIPVRPHTRYLVVGSFRTTGPVNTAFFGARLAGQWPPTEQHFGPTVGFERITVEFRTRDEHSVTIFAGFWGVGEPASLEIDNVAVLSP